MSVAVIPGNALAPADGLLDEVWAGLEGVPGPGARSPARTRTASSDPIRPEEKVSA